MHGGFVCRLHGGAAPQVKRKAAERLADLIDPDRVLREAALVAYSDIGQYFDAHGNILPMHRWPAEARRAIAGVEVVQQNLAAGDGHTDTVHKFKLWNKPQAMELLFKHLGLLVERIEIAGVETLAAKVQKARQRVDKKA